VNQSYKLSLGNARAWAIFSAWRAGCGRAESRSPQPRGRMGALGAGRRPDASLEVGVEPFEVLAVPEDAVLGAEHPVALFGEEEEAGLDLWRLADTCNLETRKFWMTMTYHLQTAKPALQTCLAGEMLQTIGGIELYGPRQLHTLPKGARLFGWLFLANPSGCIDDLTLDVYSLASNSTKIW